MKTKFNPKNTYKELQEMKPTQVDKLLLWLFLLLGLFFYEFFPDKESLLGLLSFALVYKLSHILGWSIVFVIHFVYCKTHHLHIDGNERNE